MTEVTQHADYPHEPGYLLDCMACESECHCGPDVDDGNVVPCVFCAEGGE